MLFSCDQCDLKFLLNATLKTHMHHRHQKVASENQRDALFMQPVQFEMFAFSFYGNTHCIPTSPVKKYHRIIIGAEMSSLVFVFALSYAFVFAFLFVFVFAFVFVSIFALFALSSSPFRKWHQAIRAEMPVACEFIFLIVCICSCIFVYSFLCICICFCWCICICIIITGQKVASGNQS